MRLIIAFFLTAIFLLSTAFAPHFGDIPTPQINGNWLVDIRTICAVGAVVLGGTWWVARWMARVEARFTALELNAGDRQEMLHDIKKQLESISCGECAHDFKRKNTGL